MESKSYYFCLIGRILASSANNLYIKNSPISASFQTLNFEKSLYYQDIFIIRKVRSSFSTIFPQNAFSPASILSFISSTSLSIAPASISLSRLEPNIKLSQSIASINPSVKKKSISPFSTLTLFTSKVPPGTIPSGSPPFVFNLLNALIFATDKNRVAVARV